MGPVVQFVLALSMAATSLAGSSLLWPRFTKAPRPKLLDRVHDAVLQTDQGKNAAAVLGVSDESNVTPINIGQTVGGVIGGAKQAVQKRIQTVVVTNAVNTLKGQFDRLPTDKRKEVQEIICRPPEK